MGLFFYYLNRVYWFRLNLDLLSLRRRFILSVRLLRIM